MGRAGQVGGSPSDFTFPIAHLVEVAVRHLSPEIKDPRTAVSVLNRLGAALAWLSLRHLDSDVRLRDGWVRLLVRPLGYGEVVGVMFDMIRLLIEKATSHRLKPCRPASLDAPENPRTIGDSCGQRNPAESGRRQPQR